MGYIFCSNMTCDQFGPSRAPARQWTTCTPKGGSCGKRFPDAAWGTRERPRFVDILAQPRPAALLPAPDRLRPLTQFPSPPAWWLAAPRVAVLPDPGVRWACRRGWWWGGAAWRSGRFAEIRSDLRSSSASPCLVIGWRRPPRAKRDRQVRGALGQVRALAPACRPVVRGGWVQPWVPGNPLFFPPSMRSCEFQTGGVHRGLPPRADCWKCLSSFLLGEKLSSKCDRAFFQGHAALDTPDPVWPRKPSRVRPGQCLDGGPPGKPRCHRRKK